MLKKTGRPRHTNFLGSTSFKRFLTVHAKRLANESRRIGTAICSQDVLITHGCKIMCVVVTVLEFTPNICQ